MSIYEHTKYIPGIYLEMYHAIDGVSYSRRSGCLHAYLVYRTPDGRTLVLRGGEPTRKNQGLLIGNTFGLLGGYVETQTGALSASSDHYSDDNRPHRMVIPVATGAYDAVLWEKATRRVKEINEQQYDYDVTDNSQIGNAQNSNSVVVAALREMGVNPLDVVPEDLVPYLPGIENDLTHGPDESPPSDKRLSIKRTGRAQPEPVVDELRERERKLLEEAKKRQEQLQKQLEDRGGWHMNTPADRKNDFARADRSMTSDPAAGTATDDVSAIRSGTSEAAFGQGSVAPPERIAALKSAIMAPPADPVEAANLANAAEWNHGQLTHVMQSDPYWQGWHPQSRRARGKVTEAFQALVKRQGDRPRKGVVQPADLPAPAATPRAADGKPLQLAQQMLANAVSRLAGERGEAPVVRSVQRTANRLTARPDDKPSSGAEPLKIDGDFGPRTQARTRETLHDHGPAPLLQAAKQALEEEEVGHPGLGRAATMACGFQPHIPV